jgi:outer membrane protein assembly factor BamB
MIKFFKMVEIKKIFLLIGGSILFFVFCFPVSAEDWPQDIHDAQRTGYTNEDPLLPWTFVWTWNGPDENGGTGNHFYHQPEPYVPWEARLAIADNKVFVPANNEGLYCLNLANGSPLWNLRVTSFNATPAYDSSTHYLYAGGDDGWLYKINSTNGNVAEKYYVGGKLRKPLLLVGDFVYVFSGSGDLHKVDTATMTSKWIYHSGSTVQTLAAYSPSRDIIIFGTADLYVHAVKNSNGALKWKVKPTPNQPSEMVDFIGGWPVIAEDHGLVFIRLSLGEINKVIGAGGGPNSVWPSTNVEIKSRLSAHPELKTFFPLNLDDGTEKFVAAVAPSGVEQLTNGSPRLRIHTFPVVRKWAGKEVVYTIWQNGQNDGSDAWFDGRGDSQVGEMVLDNNTVDGYEAGDLRFVKFASFGYYVSTTDEGCPLTMAGEVIFHSHWGASEAVRIVNRGSNVGLTLANPIITSKIPPVIRRLDPCGVKNTTTHYFSCPYNVCLFDDGRPYPDREGWWVYWGVLDPPTPHRNAYSEGILPRYTYVAGGYVVIEGNGGDILVLKHSGSVVNPSPTPSPSYLKGDVNLDHQVDAQDARILFSLYRSTVWIANLAPDPDRDGVITLNDFGYILKEWGLGQ